MMPSPERYAELILALRECNQASEAAEDDAHRLVTSRRALQAVLRYLWADPEVIKDSLTAPLAALRSAAFDAGQGARPMLLAHQPEGQKPNGLVREVLQGTMVAAVELLRTGKMGKEAAIKWVVREARQRGLRAEDGSFITTRQVNNWGTDISRGKAPKLARETLENVRNEPIKSKLFRGPRLPENREKAEKLAGLLIQAAATVAPRAAPKLTHRASR